MTDFDVVQITRDFRETSLLLYAEIQGKAAEHGFSAIKRKCFGNLCGGCRLSPHLNASSRTPLLEHFASGFRLNLNVVSDVVPHLNGIPSKQLKPSIAQH